MSESQYSVDKEAFLFVNAAFKQLKESSRCVYQARIIDWEKVHAITKQQMGSHV